MAVTVTTIRAGSASTSTAVADIIASADADTTATFPHLLGVAPLEVYITPLLQAEALLSGWAVTTIDATNVVLTKSTAVGSENAAAQIRLIVKRPHSITL